MQQTGVYILQSQRNGRYYIGSTDNLERRIGEHNMGLVRATSFIRPLVLKRFIECKDISEARKAEYRLKRYKSRDIVEKVIESGILPWEYKSTGA